MVHLVERKNSTPSLGVSLRGNNAQSGQAPEADVYPLSYRSP
jgi:hypothetical protein